MEEQYLSTIEVELQDVNLDGYLDLVVMLGGTRNEDHRIYVWEVSSKSYTYVTFEGFDLLSYFEIYEGYVRNWTKDSIDVVFVEDLVWNGNTLTLKSRERIVLGE